MMMNEVRVYDQVYRVGEAVYYGSKPERYGRIVALRPGEFDEELERPWPVAYATIAWKKGIRKPSELPVHHVTPFSTLLREEQRKMEKWKGLEAAALAL